jgi:acetolactate synthase-1/2/3 large subunit
VLVIATEIPAALRRPGVVGGSLHEAAAQRAMFVPVTKGTFAWPDVSAAAGAALAAPRRPVYLEIAADVLAA